MEEKKVIKKRGRKSKTDIVAKNVKIDYKKYDDNKIIHIKNSNDGGTDNLEDNIETLCTTNSETLYSEVDYKSTIGNCWNCVEKIDNLVGYPINNNNNVFYCYGDFCSFGCCGRYLLDKYSNQELWEKLYLLNIMYNKISNTVGESVKISPDRRLLDKFGGSMSINEYRSDNENINYYDITLPPIIPVNHTLIKHNELVNVNNKEDLRLYRKNADKKSKHSIFKTMNIQNS